MADLINRGKVQLVLQSTGQNRLHQELRRRSSAHLGRQKRFIAPVLRLLRPYPIVLLGDWEFQSVKLASWLCRWGVDFALRQRKITCIEDDEQIYQALKDLGIEPVIKI